MRRGRPVEEGEAPICPRCGVTMLPDGDGWVCAECEDAGVEPDES
jgi:tRNA(Ile2) C34 agmatinyltransferase TiaS